MVESTGKRAFASALDWPGWARVAKTEDAALAVLAEHAPRYARVAAVVKLPFAPGDYEVVERFAGTPTMDFGVPDLAAAAESERLSAIDAQRMTALMAAAWTVFNRVVATAPPSLRKGPRGGGRDRDAIAEHVVGAEQAYARKIGVMVRAPAGDDTKAIRAMREAILAVLAAARAGEPLAPRGWLPRYAARRIAWHALDHAWEIENRSDG
ncbi:MAG: hypothetical protein M3Z57_04740 [Candidatus Dormibacteraeota bacterium]|nr:hypothetical protein [Candidatus Dormibacteraeota bacterium]